VISDTCLACHCLVNAQNQSKTTAALGKPCYCSECDDLALAHIMLERFTFAMSFLKNSNPRGRVNVIAAKLLKRLGMSMNSLLALRRSGCFVEHNHDPATILRAMYDATFQLEYLLHDPTKSAQLAADFFDFQEIERHKKIVSLQRYKNDFVQRLNRSLLRTQNEAAINAAFSKVERRFRKGKGYRDTWHGKNLRQLCWTKDREEEYDFMIVLLHGATHSSPQTLYSGAAISPSIILLMASNLMMRAIAAALDYNGIQVDVELKGEIEQARENFVTGFHEN
jgi:hypothetical protein